MISSIKATTKDAEIVAKLVCLLLTDFNKKGNKGFKVDLIDLELTTKKFLKKRNYAAYIAYSIEKVPIGLITIAEGFSIYNGGYYGIITELYVDPENRSTGIGKHLLNDAIRFAAINNWKKIEVGTPLPDEWPRTILFYKKNGFNIKGSKMRIDLNAPLLE